MEDKLTNAAQENILTLLCFDKASLPVLTNTIKVELFESAIFREIASQALSFYQEFKKPVAEHLPDTLTHVLEGNDRGKSELYKQVIQNLYDNKEFVNKEYVLKDLKKFIKRQTLKLGVLKAAELLQAGKDEEAEAVLEKAKKKEIGIFDPGTYIADASRSLRFFDTNLDFIPTGIPELDRYGIAPAPKKLFTFAGLSGVGKTWFFIHLAKIAMVLRKRVLHISLEMSEEEICQRYMQNIFGYAKRNEKVEVPIFRKDEMGRFASLDFTTIKPKGHFDDPKARKKLEKQLQGLRTSNLIVKDFPTGDLSFRDLIGYLENLIAFEKFHPHLILIDEPDLMRWEGSDLRLGLRQLYINIRGMAINYNLAAAAISQTSKGAKTARWIDERYLAEDFNKMRISDNLISFNQTDMEYEHNLARLFGVKVRGDKKGIKVLLSQNYAMGQFCADSTKMATNYWKLPILKEEKDSKDKEEV